MAGYRQAHSRMWSDGWFAELQPLHKLLFVYLFTNERASVAGIYELPVRIIQFETGLDKDTILAGFAEFQKAEPAKVLYDAQTGVVYVRNMLKYQGSTSPHVKKRIQGDLKAVPECALKTLWMQSNRVWIGYEEGIDTSSSSSSSSYSSSYSSVEGGGVGEETNWIPETPKDAVEHPDIQIYQKVSGRFPGQRDYATVIKTIHYLREKQGEGIVDYLTPYWTAWSTRKTKENKPYSPSSLVWLCEWAMQSEIPKANGHEPKQGESNTQTQDVIRKVAQRANAH